MARTIKIENTTISPKTWVGQLLAAAEIFDIPQNKFFKWANDATVITDVASGDLKVIKSTGPTVYYTAVEGQRVLNGVETNVASAGLPGELLCSSPTGDLVWTPVVGGTVAFFSDGVTNNKWLKVGDGQIQTSDKSPVILPYDAVIYALTFTNKTDSADVDFDIHKNGVSSFVWNLATKRYAWKTNGLSAVEFNAGDRMSVFATSSGTAPNNPLLVVHFSFKNANQGEGGGTTL